MLVNAANYLLITFRVRRSRGEMHIGQDHLCVCVCLCVCLSVPATFPHYCTDPEVSWANFRGCPLVVHHWADLQSVHGFRCYDNIAPNAKCQRVLVLGLCVVTLLFDLCETADEKARNVAVVLGADVSER